MSPAEAGRYTRATSYHTAFVMGFCCAAALRGGPPAQDVPATERSEVVWPELYGLVGHHRGHWQPVFATLADAQKESLTPMLADMATLDALEARDYRRAGVVLRLADRGGVDGPMQRRARAVMTASWFLWLDVFLHGDVRAQLPRQIVPVPQALFSHGWSLTAEGSYRP